MFSPPKETLIDPVEGIELVGVNLMNTFDETCLSIIFSIVPASFVYTGEVLFVYFAILKPY